MLLACLSLGAFPVNLYEAFLVLLFGRTFKFLTSCYDEGTSIRERILQLQFVRFGNKSSKRWKSGF